MKKIYILILLNLISSNLNSSYLKFENNEKTPSLKELLEKRNNLLENNFLINPENNLHEIDIKKIMKKNISEFIQKIKYYKKQEPIKPNKKTPILKIELSKDNFNILDYIEEKKIKKNNEIILEIQKIEENKFKSIINILENLEEEDFKDQYSFFIKLGFENKKILQKNTDNLIINVMLQITEISTYLNNLNSEIESLKSYNQD